MLDLSSAGQYMPDILRSQGEGKDGGAGGTEASRLVHAGSLHLTRR
jgi:hypothetical protein